MTCQAKKGVGMASATQAIIAPAVQRARRPRQTRVRCHSHVPGGGMRSCRNTRRAMGTNTTPPNKGSRVMAPTSRSLSHVACSQPGRVRTQARVGLTAIR